MKTEQHGGIPADRGLLARLMQTVRPEFRGEVFHPPRDSPVFYQGECRIPSCPTAISFGSKQLCQGHYQRWKADGHPDLEQWCREEDAATARRLTVQACGIRGCERAHKAHGLCHRHILNWEHAGRPDVEAWTGRTLYVPPRGGHAERGCGRPGCGRWTDGPSLVFCRNHHEQWRQAGRPAAADWLAELAHGGDPRVRLHDLPRNVRLELQFGLQCRHDEGTKRTPVRSVVQAAGWVRESGVSSLLDLSEEQWRDRVGHGQSVSVLARVFILDTRFRLQLLLIGDDPWADQYPRGEWDLRLLGIDSEDVRRLRFGPIPQPWLRDLAKRWCRWRLSRGIAPVTVRTDLAALHSLARHLPATAGPGSLGREQLEGWLAALRTERPHPSRASWIIAAGSFLRDVHRHEWEPGLPSGTLIYHDDMPGRAPRNPRWIPEFLMRQLETPEALAQFPSDFGRVMLQILIACGLRLKDTRTLPADCVVRDNAGAPYLAWLNRKMQDRAAFFPISESLADEIAGQQQRVRTQYPNGSPWLFPARQANLDGRKHTSGTRFTDELAEWLERVRLADEHGNPVKVTCHQFRHTLGTRLINADVPQHVVQQLLDHMSPDMTAVYARLHLDTVRRHWENALKVDADGDPVALPDGHPLATAQWMRVSMVRAKVTLPNSYCGAPVQTDCEYANPCLDCRFFITTPDFLAQHRQQREETHQMIAQAGHSGLARIAEKNTRVLGKLDKIITALEQAGPGQVVSGGKVTEFDAAG
jgi:integrase